MKVCSSCKVRLTSENGYVRKAGPDRGRLKDLCRPCGRRKSSEWNQSNPEKAAQARRSWSRRNPEKTRCSSRLYNDDFRVRLNMLKSERPCYDCGQKFPPECMDFDHVTGTKSFGISNGVSRTWEEVRLEIDKCQLVCACCHRTRTKNRARK